VRWIAVPGAVAQIVTATALGAGIARLWGWPLASGMVFGLALSVASTVVLLRALEDRDRLHTSDGRIAVGWLIVEDLVMVLVLVLLPALATPPGARPPEDGTLALLLALAVTLGKVAVFIAFMLIGGRRIFPWLLDWVDRTRSRELFTLAVASLALGVAFASAKFFGVSLALGAFFAGIVINESGHSHRAAQGLQPLQDAFGVLFFVAVGMLFDPAILVEHPWHTVMAILVIMVGKSLAALCIVLALRRPWHTALTVATALAQIGEFSFILGGLGVSLGVLPAEALNVIVAGALVSISLNPLVFYLVDRWSGPALRDQEVLSADSERSSATRSAASIAAPPNRTRS
jgi:CPA2 family monovalent cation:H+ antiporter-2